MLAKIHTERKAHDRLQAALRTEREELEQGSAELLRAKAQLTEDRQTFDADKQACLSEQIHEHTHNTQRAFSGVPGGLASVHSFSYSSLGVLCPQVVLLHPTLISALIHKPRVQHKRH